MMNIYKKINMIGVHWEMQFLGGRGSRKKQDIAELPKWGKYRQFADLRASWRKRRRWCFWERADTPMLPMCSFHGRHVLVRETGNMAWYVFVTVKCTTSHEFHRILYIQTAHVFEGNFKPQLQVFEVFFSGNIISSDKSSYPYFLI